MVKDTFYVLNQTLVVIIVLTRLRLHWRCHILHWRITEMAFNQISQCGRSLV